MALEIQQLEKLQKDSDNFLNQQADLFSKIGGTKIKFNKKDRITSIGTGASIDDSTPIRLSVQSVKERKMAEVEASKFAELRQSALSALADDDDGTIKRKRELIPLSYSDDEAEDEEEAGMTNEQKLERRREKIKSLVETIPVEKEGLWAWEVRWDKLNEVRYRFRECDTFVDRNPLFAEYAG